MQDVPAGMIIVSLPEHDIIMPDKNDCQAVTKWIYDYSH